MQKLDGLCRQVADRKCPPSQPSPRRRPPACSGEGAGTGLGGAARTSPAGAGPGTGSCSWAGGPPGQTPGAPSPSEARRSQLPAPPSPPPVCPSPAGKQGGERSGRKEVRKTQACRMFWPLDNETGISFKSSSFNDAF